MSTYGTLDDTKVLEHSTLKVPYETLNKLYRNVQKSIDRDCSALNQSVVSTDKLIRTHSDINKTDLIAAFSSLVDKLKSFKKRSNDLHGKEKSSLILIKRRIEHLKNYASPDKAVVKSFKRQRIDRILIDYFLRSGFYETSSLLASKSNIEYLTNIDVFSSEKQVIQSLKQKETTACLNWCNENKSKLKKINVNLKFNLLKKHHKDF
jgi:macrophage erythroblast attacher